MQPKFLCDISSISEDIQDFENTLKNFRSWRYKNEHEDDNPPKGGLNIIFQVGWVSMIK